MPEIFTVGHSTHSSEVFLDILLSHDIELIADVRRFPGSRRYPWFNGEQLQKEAKLKGIDYIHIEQLGGRRKVLQDSPHTEWKNSSFRGYADYMDTPEFKDAVVLLEKAAAEKRTAIMCAESLWWRCHRSMIADYLLQRGWTVWHIMGTGKKSAHPEREIARQQRLF